MAAVDAQGHSALELAAKKGSTAVARALLASAVGGGGGAGGAGGQAGGRAATDSELQTDGGTPPSSAGGRKLKLEHVIASLTIAARAGHTDFVQLAIEAGAPLQPVLMRAATLGDTELALVLLKVRSRDMHAGRQAGRHASRALTRAISLVLLNSRRARRAIST